MSQLDKNKIKVFALSIADAGEFGLVRLITEEPQKTAKLLEDAEFNLAKSKKNTEVTATFISEQNPLSKITKILGDGGINIELLSNGRIEGLNLDNTNWTSATLTIPVPEPCTIAFLTLGGLLLAGKQKGKND